MATINSDVAFFWHTRTRQGWIPMVVNLIVKSKTKFLLNILKTILNEINHQH